ncbi:MAG: tRNA (adenosine(37)-N6)-threonylcarbamoyltransferase complex transferase subunit TsaD [Clostridiales bacterium]|nr:tRNA (adenosine(37)-N6)-threonylcarbamoyltransferase complex transferase subunit TsaD [Clostridiales bacterium]
MYIDIAKEKFNNLQNKDVVTILSIESSCDDTSVAVVRNGRELLSNVISSQIDIHTKFGGVVPEVASRNHLLAISNIVDKAMLEAGLTLSDIDAVAVTYGAGLVGSLMVGVNYAKSLAFALNVPLIKVNHIKAHISANYLAHNDLKPPYLALVVSGGHTALINVKSYNKFEVVGTTHDDAIGEAYDKVAKVLGLGYPGGPIVDKLAKEGQNNIQFVKPNYNKKEANFSYSGLKTAVINYIHKLSQNGETPNVNDVCASFQTQAVDEVVTKTINTAKRLRAKKIVMAGGVACNSHLRERMREVAQQNNIELYYPSPILCTDNAGMVGAEAYYLLMSGEGLSDIDLTPNSLMNLKYTNK